MAGYSRIKGMKVVLSAETGEFEKKLDTFVKQTNKVTSALKDVNKLLKVDPTNTVLLTQKQKLLKEAIDKTKEELDAERLKLKQLGEEKQTEKVINDQRRLERQIAETSSELKKLEKQYYSFGSVGIQQLDAVGKKMQQIGDGMMSVGKTMTRYVTTPIVGVGTLAVKEYADFEQAMAKVGAVAQATGKKVTNSEGQVVDALEGMSEYAREVAATTKFTAGEVTDAYYYMSLAGWEPQESMDALVDMLNLVAASGEDLGRVSDIVTDGMTAFGMESTEAKRFVDVLAVAMSNTNTTVDQLGEAFKYVAPVAGAMGYEIEDVAVALGTMANNGIKGSTAGTALRNILTNLANPTGEMATALDMLGISLEDGQGNMYSFADVMGQFRSNLGAIKMPIEEYQQQLALLEAQLEEGTIDENEYADSVERLTERAYGAEGALMAKYASTIAGKRGMAGLMAIVSASEDDWNGLTNAIENSTGASETMREEMEDTLSGQLLILKSQVSELAMEFAEEMMPAIRDAVEWLQGLVKKFQSLSPETKSMIAKIALLVATIGPLLIVGGALIKGIGFILTIPAMIMKGVGTIIAVGGKLIAGIGKVIAFLGPAGLIAVAVGALILFVVTHWEEVKTFMINLWETIKTKASEIWEAIKEAVSKPVEAVKNWLSTTWETIKTKAVNLWNTIKTTATNVWNGVKTAVITPINALKSWLSSAWSGIKSTASSVWEGIKKVITNPIETAKNTIKGIIDKIKGFFPISLSNIFSSFKLPHIRVTKKTGILGIPYPSFSVDWYKKAYENGIRFTQPTILPTASGYKGFGDGNGAELVMGENRLMSMIQRASGIDANAIYNAVLQGASQANINVYIDGKDVTAVVNRHNTNQQIGNIRFRGAF